MQSTLSEGKLCFYQIGYMSVSPFKAEADTAG